jgi:hypothetical protein
MSLKRLLAIAELFKKLLGSPTSQPSPQIFVNFAQPFP